jgi:hypothetical protein
MTAPPPFAKAMLAEAARLRAVRSQLMARVQEYENAATGD